MKPAEIKQALHAKGYSQSLIAKTLGMNPVTIGRVINRKNRSYNIASAIAKILGKDITEVFDDVPSYATPPVDREKAAAELKSLLAQD